MCWPGPHQYFIGKIIILIDQQIELVVGLLHDAERRDKTGCAKGLIDIDFVGENRPVFAGKGFDFRIDITGQHLLLLGKSWPRRHHREVPAHDQILIVQRCWLLTNRQITKETLEFSRFGDIIIVLEGREQETLAKAARA